MTRNKINPACAFFAMQRYVYGVSGQEEIEHLRKRRVRTSGTNRVDKTDVCSTVSVQ